MKAIFKSLFAWFMILAFSIIVSYGFKWTDQGKAFCYITLSFDIILALIAFVSLLVSREDVNIKAIIQTVDIVWFTLLFICAIWGAAKFFKIDFRFEFLKRLYKFCIQTDENGHKITTTNTTKQQHIYKPKQSEYIPRQFIPTHNDIL